MFKWDTVKPNVDNEITIIVKQQQSLLIYGGDETRHQWDGKIKSAESNCVLTICRKVLKSDRIYIYTTTHSSGRLDGAIAFRMM
jgi:hypothetical protein